MTRTRSIGQRRARAGGPGRLRRGALLALGLVLAPVVLAPAAHAATLAAPSAKIAFGDRSITLAWKAVAGATGYRVQYTAGSTWSGAATVDAGTRTSLLMKGLTNRTRYHARVVAVAGSQKAVGASLAATPDAGYPRELTVSAVPAGADKVRVSWTGQGRATKVGVIAGSDGGITQDTFHSAWYPATTTSITLTVPAARRARLGTGTGNPVFVKVATYNSLTAGTAMPATRDETAAYRLSAAGTYAQAGATAPGGARLRVAEYNVNSVAASAGFNGYTWADRRTKVAAAIARSGAAVVATAELTTADAGLGNGAKQWQDLRDLLAKDAYGRYSIANDPTGALRGGVSNTTVGAHLFYRSSVVTRLAGGFVSPRDTLAVSWPAGLTDRWFSWAEFRVRATGEVFYAAAVHLPANAGSTSYAALRTREIGAIDAYLSAKAGRLPLLVMGDFNEAFADAADSPSTVLDGRGYYDAAATATRSNTRYSTVNITHQIDNLAVRGYPFTPYAYKYYAPRIDFIMVKNSPGSSRYTNQVVLSNGTFDRAYQGSDHNLQWADIGIR